MTGFDDYYEALQVSPTAEPEVIEKAYKALIFKHHPDRGGDEERAKRITGAFAVLRDPKTRAEYDSAWQARQSMNEHAATSEVPSSGPEYQYVRYEDIPPEVIDAILSAMLLEMVGATARTAVRITGAAAAIAVEAGKSGLATASASYKKAKRERAEALERYQDYEDSKAEKAYAATADWYPPVSSGALRAFDALIDNKQASLANLRESDLVWLAIRHPHAAVRSRARGSVRERVPTATMLAGLTAEGETPILLVSLSEPDTTPLAVAGRKVRSAKVVDEAGLQAWARSVERQRLKAAKRSQDETPPEVRSIRIGMAIMAIVLVALAGALWLLWSQGALQFAGPQ